MADETVRKSESVPDMNETIEVPSGVGLKVARHNLSDLVLRAGYGNERIELTRKGKPICALIGLKDLERLRSLDAA